jgi:hypothetical protein
MAVRQRYKLKDAAQIEDALWQEVGLFPTNVTAIACNTGAIDPKFHTIAIAVNPIASLDGN